MSQSTKNLKVALYHPWLHMKGGGEKVILKLMEKGKFDYDLYTNYYRQEETFKEFEDIEVNELTPDAAMEGVLKRGMFFGLGKVLPSKIPNLEDYDALLVSTGGIAELLMYRNNDIPSLAYCHTPLRIVHDKSVWKDMKRRRGPFHMALYYFLTRGYDLLERIPWARFNHVICNSENTKGRVVGDRLKVGSDVSVINPGADISKFMPTGTFEKTFFVPGRINNYKRQHKAIEAFKKFVNENDLIGDFKLVISGYCQDKSDSYYQELLEEAEGYDIEVLRNTPTRKYMEFYRSCYAVLFTAINEDWGLVPIEANACGKLCISVNEGGPKESIEDGKNGFLVDDMEEMAEKMRFLAMNPDYVRDKEKVCREEAKKYAWDIFAESVEEKIQKEVKQEEAMERLSFLAQFS